jgi:hypothetical protein
MKKLLILGFIILGTLFFGYNQNTFALTVPRQDSDGDGLFDFYEENVWGTDPRNKDTDGDGFSDSDELRYGYDPLDPTPFKRYLAVTYSPVIRSQDIQVHGSSYLGQYAQVNTLSVNNISSLDFLRVEGVSYLGGTLVNPTDAPITLGDNLRVDGEIWAGPQKGTGDNLSLKISDTMIPTLTNLNDLGSENKRWRNIYTSGNIKGNHLSLTGDIEANNLTLAGNIEAKTSNVDTLYADTAEIGNITGTTISGTSINGTSATFSDLTVSRKLDVLGKLKAGVGATKDVDILGDLKVTGEIDPIRVVIQPIDSSTDPLLVNDASSNEIVKIAGNGDVNFGGGYAAGGVTVEQDGDASIGGRLNVDAASFLNGITYFGGGYGSSVAEIDDNGNLRMDGELTVDEKANFGGGYGDSVDGGVTIYYNGVIQTDGKADFAGGYAIGGSGVTIGSDGDLFMNGTLQVNKDTTFGGGNGSGTISVENTHWFQLKERSGSGTPTYTCNNATNKGVIIFWEDSGATNTGFWGCDGSNWKKF